MSRRIVTDEYHYEHVDETTIKYNPASVPAPTPVVYTPVTYFTRSPSYNSFNLKSSARPSRSLSRSSISYRPCQPASPAPQPVTTNYVDIKFEEQTVSRPSRQRSHSRTTSYNDGENIIDIKVETNDDHETTSIYSRPRSTSRTRSSFLNSYSNSNSVVDIRYEADNNRDKTEITTYETVNRPVVSNLRSSRRSSSNSFSDQKNTIDIKVETSAQPQQRSSSKSRDCGCSGAGISSSRSNSSSGRRQYQSIVTREPSTTSLTRYPSSSSLNRCDSSNNLYQLSTTEVVQTPLAPKPVPKIEYDYKYEFSETTTTKKKAASSSPLASKSLTTFSSRIEPLTCAPAPPAPQPVTTTRVYYGESEKPQNSLSYVYSLNSNNSQTQNSSSNRSSVCSGSSSSALRSRSSSSRGGCGCGCSGNKYSAEQAQPKRTVTFASQDNSSSSAQATLKNCLVKSSDATQLLPVNRSVNLGSIFTGNSFGLLSKCQSNLKS
jgi:hypothetical protein